MNLNKVAELGPLPRLLLQFSVKNFQNSIVRILPEQGPFLFCAACAPKMGQLRNSAENPLMCHKQIFLNS